MRQKIFTLSKDDFEIQTFASGGPGGQHQNKTESGVRIIHRASGAVGESRSERSQHQNKRIAFKRLCGSAKFRLWAMRRAAEFETGKTIDELVDVAMSPENLKIETVDERGRWVEVTTTLQ